MAHFETLPYAALRPYTGLSNYAGIPLASYEGIPREPNTPNEGV